MTSGMLESGLVVNCCSNESVINSALSVAAKTKPFGTESGWDGYDLFSRD